VSTVELVTAGELGPSWRPGCPVGPERLRRIRVRHWGFDDQPHDGDLIVREDVTAAVAAVFGRLYEDRFPIRQVRTIDHYGGDDDASMADDNTSAFNCRPVAGTTRWSQHAYGLAIDVNPVENPYVRPSRIDPPAGAAFADRRDVRPGMAVPGSSIVRAFDAAGWGWGGRWAAPDLQHFSASGR
jgi:hypothetical protein